MKPGSTRPAPRTSRVNRRPAPDVPDGYNGEARIRALSDKHGPALFRYCVRLAKGDTQMAEDWMQEILLKAWRHPEVPEGSEKAWLFTVASHLAVDAARARRARPKEAGPVLIDAAVPASSYEDQVLDSATVASAVASLSPAHREVLVQTYYLQRSVAEAASALRIPPGTVKSRAFYALAQLRLILEEMGLEPPAQHPDAPPAPNSAPTCSEPSVPPATP